MIKHLLCLTLVALVPAAGCSAATAPLEVRKEAIRQADLVDLMREAKKERVAAMDAEKYAGRRKELIGGFRLRADELKLEAGSLEKALELVTPASSGSRPVPVRVLRASFGGVPSWVVLQKWGRPGKEPAHVKVWVVRVSDQSVLYAASMN
ncbi:MAG: hypothetical protein C4521_10710 [Actinobacteria bacterium]|nr:MAG: hypothetical protein C4521_10710 [Actinomycetota bacterium]